MYGERYRNLLPFDRIEKLREEQEGELVRITHWDKHRELLERFPSLAGSEIRYEDGAVASFRASPEFEQEHRAYFDELIRSLIPWRKGPFNLLGHEIDAEWQSNLKWDRIVPHLPELRGRRVLDVGCNNGYYLFQLLRYNPELLVGLDPSSRCYYQFELFRRFLPHEKLFFEVFGIEHLDLYQEFFDIVFCLGVIYHRRDPYTSCRMLFETMRERGTLFIESLVYPGEDPIAFCPPGRYAKMRNVWYVPSVSCLMGWLDKAGFVEIQEISTTTVTLEEQRQTELAPYESLSDFLDPNDHTKTVEGHPAPVRSIIKATKRS